MKKLIRIIICITLVFLLMVVFQEMSRMRIIVDFNTAYTYSTLSRVIMGLKIAYPALIKVNNIGFSAMNRKIPIIMLGKGEKKALIVSAIHAREFLTAGFTMRCVEEYAKAYYSESGMYGKYNIKQFLNDFTLFLVPVANPDGLEIVTAEEFTLYDCSRKEETYKRNANGVNLNRNFPFFWEKITDGKDIALENFKGNKKSSEPETQALIKLCKEENFEWMFSMHLKGNNIFWRDEANGEIQGDEKIADKLVSECSYIKSQVTNDVNAYAGGFENWFRSTFGKPAFCIELVPLDKNYNYEPERTNDFENLTNWNKTKYTFLQGMI